MNMDTSKFDSKFYVTKRTITEEKFCVYAGNFKEAMKAVHLNIVPELSGGRSCTQITLLSDSTGATQEEYVGDGTLFEA